MRKNHYKQEVEEVIKNEFTAKNTIQFVTTNK